MNLLQLEAWHWWLSAVGFTAAGIAGVAWISTWVLGGQISDRKEKDSQVKVLALELAAKEDRQSAEADRKFAEGERKKVEALSQELAKTKGQLEEATKLLQAADDRTRPRRLTDAQGEALTAALKQVPPGKVLLTLEQPDAEFQLASDIASAFARAGINVEPTGGVTNGGRGVHLGVSPPVSPQAELEAATLLRKLREAFQQAGIEVAHGVPPLLHHYPGAMVIGVGAR